MTCRKETGTPLERFDGEYFCSECRKSLFPGNDFAINERNATVFAESERHFYEGYILGKSVEELETALELCRASAYDKNPYAAVAMGYYYERKYLGEGSGYVRAKNAFKWYKLIAIFGEKFREVFGGVAPTLRKGNSAPPDELVLVATRNIYYLLCGVDSNIATEVVKSEPKTKNTDIAYVLERLEAVLGLAEKDRPKASQAVDADQFAAKFGSGKLICGLQEVSETWLGALCELWRNPTRNKELNALFGSTYSFWVAGRGGYGNLQPVRSADALEQVLGSGAEYYLAAYCRREISGFRRGEEIFRDRCKELRDSGLMYDFRTDDISISRARNFGDFVKYIFNVSETEGRK